MIHTESSGPVETSFCSNLRQVYRTFPAAECVRPRSLNQRCKDLVSDRSLLATCLPDPCLQEPCGSEIDATPSEYCGSSQDPRRSSASHSDVSRRHG